METQDVAINNYRIFFEKIYTGKLSVCFPFISQNRYMLCRKRENSASIFTHVIQKNKYNLMDFLGRACFYVHYVKFYGY